MSARGATGGGRRGPAPILLELIGGLAASATAASWFFTATCDEDLPLTGLAVLFVAGLAMAAFALATSDSTLVRRGGPVAVLAAGAAVAGLGLLRTFDCIA